MRGVVLVLCGVAIAIAILGRPPQPQDPAYHLMADRRTLLGIPNCLNVLSNLPFAVVAAFGLAALFGKRSPGAGRDSWDRWPLAIVFVGTALTTAGSAYYHLAPDNARLLWDRLPMTVGFIGLLVAILAERVSLRAARLLFAPLLAAGVASVLWWYWSEMHGRGDLRPYALVQFGSLTMTLAILFLYPGDRRRTALVIAALGTYALAKAFEAADGQVFALGGIVSGHTLKHLTAAAAVAWLAAMPGPSRRVEAYGASWSNFPST